MTRCLCGYLSRTIPCAPCAVAIETRRLPMTPERFALVEGRVIETSRPLETTPVQRLRVTQLFRKGTP